jgi:hypothetical protein
MSKRAFRSAPPSSTPAYPTLRRFLGPLAGLGLALLASGCEPEHMMGTVAQIPSLIDARADLGPEAGPQSDAGPRQPLDGGPLQTEQGPAFHQKR